LPTIQVLHETLRLYHPVFGQYKDLASSFTIGGTTVPAKTGILVS